MARSLCVLATSVFTPPTSVFTSETALETAVTCCAVCFWALSKPLGVGFVALFAVDDLLGAGVHLLLRQSQRFSSSSVATCRRASVSRNSLPASRSACLASASSRLLARQPAAQRVAPDQAAECGHKSYRNRSQKRAGISSGDLSTSSLMCFTFLVSGGPSSKPLLRTYVLGPGHGNGFLTSYWTPPRRNSPLRDFPAIAEFQPPQSKLPRRRSRVFQGEPPDISQKPGICTKTSHLRYIPAPPIGQLENLFQAACRPSSVTTMEWLRYKHLYRIFQASGPFFNSGVPGDRSFAA